MNDDIAFVQDWLADGERIINQVDEVHLQVNSWSQTRQFHLWHEAHDELASLILTNRRLLLVIRDWGKKKPPLWYSVAGIASLAEHPPGRWKEDSPYLAQLTLYSGVTLCFATPRNRIQERGKELSRFLVEAFMQLGTTHDVESLPARRNKIYEMSSSVNSVED